MKGTSLGDVLTNVTLAALTTILPASVPVFIYLFSLNGAIDYSITENKDSLFLTFNISNARSEPTNIEIGLSAVIEAIVASSGTAGIDILNPPGRSGSILSISNIPSKSEYNAIVRISTWVTRPVPILLRAPPGVELHRVDPTRGRLNLIQLSVQSSIIFLVIFFASSYQDKKRYNLEETLSDLRQKNTTNLDKLQSIQLSKDRIKVYLLARNRYLVTEIEFWRLIFERFLIADGVSKGKTRQLLAIIARKLGFKPTAGIEDTDLDLIIEMLIDEDKRKRFDDTLKRRRP